MKQIKIRRFLMNTTTDKKFTMSSVSKADGINIEQNTRNWTEYSRLIVVAMSQRMEEPGMTQQVLAKKNELHPATPIQDAERRKEYVVGNHLHD